MNQTVNDALSLSMVLTLPLLYAGCSQPEPTQSAQDDQANAGLPLITAMKGTGTPAPPESDRFSFAVFGDSQGEEKARAIITEIFKSIHDHQPDKPAFAFCLGDIVKGKDPQDPAKYIRQKFADYLELAKTAGVPVFNAPGNHEMDDAEDIPSERMHQIYRENVAPTHGAFDYGNSRFIAINTEDVPPEGTPSPPEGVEFSYLGEEQLKQIDADLEANRDKKHIFIMMHYPMKPKRPQDALSPDSLSRLSKILTKYDNIAYVFASHEHIFYNPQDPDNVKSVSPFKAGDPTRYLVSGGAGAKIYVKPEEGGYHHYLNVTVEGDTVSVTIHRVGE